LALTITDVIYFAIWMA